MLPVHGGSPASRTPLERAKGACDEIPTSWELAWPGLSNPRGYQNLEGNPAQAPPEAFLCPLPHCCPSTRLTSVETFETSPSEPVDEWVADTLCNDSSKNELGQGVNTSCLFYCGMSKGVMRIFYIRKYCSQKLLKVVQHGPASSEWPCSAHGRR